MELKQDHSHQKIREQGERIGVLISGMPLLDFAILFSPWFVLSYDIPVENVLPSWLNADLAGAISLTIGVVSISLGSYCWCRSCINRCTTAWCSPIPVRGSAVGPLS